MSACESAVTEEKGELHPLSIPERRWESVSVDLITDLPRAAKGFDTIVVVVDRLIWYTSWQAQSL